LGLDLYCARSILKKGEKELSSKKKPQGAEVILPPINPRVRIEDSNLIRFITKEAETNKRTIPAQVSFTLEQLFKKQNTQPQG
jgi:hypothetical protein